MDGGFKKFSRYGRRKTSKSGFPRRIIQLDDPSRAQRYILKRS